MQSGVERSEWYYFFSSGGFVYQQGEKECVCYSLSSLSLSVAVTLCFASVFALVAAGLLALTFSTDNWQVIKVDRDAIWEYNEEHPLEYISNKFNSSPLFYTRSRGLFRECFYKKEEAPVIELYSSPVETWCHNINYYFPDEKGETKDFTWDNMTRIHMASAVMMLVACLFAAGGMGLWHSTWPQILIDNTEFKYDWSYILCWIGIGLALVSSILFSLAAVCLKNDKEREDAMNMQYLMPVYPQKQQPYGPYGYAAYPGPAAQYYGSQYGLAYNQY
ncbi:unnamed protein product [Lepeophtheirus salmonis]|uniref:(salmon louse) hypothetical protein n=1 Tax=Lepeophtheirus salmonis TaxID=72036 RepID=A0A7R8CEZ6_LEPSM|nr:unnamed protein product [Lepeophtheirus salmonis]CAF2761558.1 unnamed protein product [Lepeophtheirus salmonis]